MKTQEELNALKEEYERLNNKLKELSEEELQEVTGGEGEGEYLYSFKKYDKIKTGIPRQYIKIEEDVQTNDSGLSVKVSIHTSESGAKVDFGNYTQRTVGSLMELYKEYGGTLG